MVYFAPLVQPCSFFPFCSLSLVCITHAVIAEAMKVNFQVYSTCGVHFVWDVSKQLYHSGSEAR